jgi:hypothetical protein
MQRVAGPGASRNVIGGVGGYEQPRCPNCQSFDISFRELIKRVAYGSILGMWLTGFIPPTLLPLKRRGWKCHSCGHSWRAEGDGQATK